MKRVRRHPWAARPIVLLMLVALATAISACGGTTSAGPATSAGASVPAGASPGATTRRSAAPASGVAAASTSAAPGATGASGASPAPSGATADAESSPSPAAATAPPLPHVLLSINDQGAYRGIVAAATWAPAGPASSRAFGAGVPAAATLRQLRARIGSVLTIAAENRPLGRVELFAAPMSRFTGKLSTSAPFTRLRYTSGTVTGGARVPFWAPDAGEWVVYARVTFTDGTGGGTWLWRVLVR